MKEFSEGAVFDDLANVQIRLGAVEIIGSDWNDVGSRRLRERINVPCHENKSGVNLHANTKHRFVLLDCK
jgi:hypothetical protein